VISGLAMSILACLFFIVVIAGILLIGAASFISFVGVVIIVMALAIFGSLVWDVIKNSYQTVKMSDQTRRIDIPSIIEPVAYMDTEGAMLSARRWFIAFSIMQIIETIFLIVELTFTVFFSIPFIMYIIFGILAFSSRSTSAISAAYAASSYSLAFNFVGVPIIVLLFTVFLLLGQHSAGLVILIFGLMWVIGKGIILFFCQKTSKVWLMLSLTSVTGGNTQQQQQPPAESSDAYAMKQETIAVAPPPYYPNDPMGGNPNFIKQ